MPTVIQLIREEDVLHITQNPQLMDALEAIVYREILSDERFKGQLANRLQKAVDTLRKSKKKD